MALYQQAMLLAIHFARSGLLGNSPIPCPSQKFLLRLRVYSPIPCPSQKFLLRLRVLQMLFPALAVYLMYGPGPDLYEIQKEKSQVQRFHFL